MINVLFQTESHFPVSREKIVSAVNERLKREIKGRVEVGVSIVGDRQMKKLNHRYRNLPETTDVLSFPMQEMTAGSKPFIEPPDHVLRLGDIVVSYPQAIIEARESNRMVDETVVGLVMHGLDHLLGIHHP